ncbi:MULTISPECIES: ABC transporter substrate-binding protein [Paenibacillus]|uniref:ABC transporter substrate-binding protein n=1 Tax=Paenibacillus TaxID=44249 RepID=UPI00096F7862|nr:extracellular solute-binding protein [Paenibacillus odorifer]OME13668.1 hypothetical protein BSK60_14935 [Paenibacillus odorifer]
MNVNGKLITVLLTFGLLLNTRGCQLSPSKEDTALQDPIQLNIWLTAGSGLESLIDQYQSQHPELEIHIQTSTSTQLPAKLQTSFAAGYSSPDVAAIDISYLDRFKQFPDYFYNLNTFDADNLKDQFLNWKWQEVLGNDFIFGLPTEIGPYAMLYRTDIFALSGLPTKPEEVAKEIQTWDQFLEAGTKVQERTGKAFVNDLENLYLTLLRQSKLQYYSPTTQELILDNNPAVKRAWDFSIQALKLNLSASIAVDTQRWGAGLLNGDFAVMLCPAWMIGHIKSSAPTASGLWNVTQIPENSANRGGSVLTLPKTGNHPDESFALIKWLTEPAQQLVSFKVQGAFPSTPEIYDDPEIHDLHDPYFPNSELGLTLSSAAKAVIPTYYGPHHADVETSMLEYLTKAEKGELTPELAWTLAVQAAKRIDSSFR